MTPRERQKALGSWICKTCFKPGGTCAGRGTKACGTTVPKSLICLGCIVFTQEKKLSPHNAIFCASKHPTHDKPVLIDVYETTDKLLWLTRAGGNSRPDTVWIVCVLMDRRIVSSRARTKKRRTTELRPSREQWRSGSYLFYPVGTCWIDSTVGFLQQRE